MRAASSLMHGENKTVAQTGTQRAIAKAVPMCNRATSLCRVLMGYHSPIHSLHLLQSLVSFLLHFQCLFVMAVV
jgi:hypothetical protein